MKISIEHERRLLVVVLIVIIGHGRIVTCWILDSCRVLDIAFVRVFVSVAPALMQCACGMSDCTRHSSQSQKHIRASPANHSCCDEIGQD